ncbi:MAG TPA: glycosyltransferase family 4 protein [Vicinamibacterales bacterium]|nr:glycosyltransferase family 4 protein [Vicinamibacterales bacterium]
MRILIPTDAFPPICGGSGWSTYELARGLRARGHDVLIVQPRPGEPGGVRETRFDGLPVRHFGAPAPDFPYVRNYYKSEKLTRSLAAYLASVLASERFDVVHGQHVMTTVAAIDAARAAGLPAVATVRDYWPVCYWSDLLHTREGLELCPACTSANMRVCIQPRAGALWPAALPMIPYMRRNLAAKRSGLARASAVIAVSRRIAEDLRARAPELSATRIEVIPNPVNVTALQQTARVPPRDAHLVEQLYAIYVGKLAPNKGTGYLVEVVRDAGLDWPLIVVGDGPERAKVESAARASGRRIEFTGWLDKDEATRLLAGASLLIFPSRGPESLSRVLIEASALGVPIAAMETGGTRDIIEPGVTGLLSSSPQQLADDVRRLRHDAPLRRSLAEAARRKVAREFDAPVVVERIEALYRELSER